MGVIKQAFWERAQNGPDLLIIGAGKNCENENSTNHKPHPKDCLTASLPKTARNVGFYANPDIEADVTETHSFVQKVRKIRPKPFKVIHFENIDNDVATSTGALASAHALLAEDGLLIIECGPLGSKFRGSLQQRPVLALQHINSILQALGFIVLRMKTDITIIARKRNAHTVRITKLTMKF